MIDDVAKAICEAAGKREFDSGCIMCDDGKCALWQSFRYEAEEAIKAVFRWHQRERRWPGFVRK